MHRVIVLKKERKIGETNISKYSYCKIEETILCYILPIKLY